jgi:CMP-N-acetylneuraminic acid synthetase
MTNDGKPVVALLPMKGNSERVPGKNFKPLEGKPLFWWILDALLAFPEIDQVVINTDARDKLAKAGLENGHAGKVLIRERKPDLCGDFVSMNLVLADDIAEIGSATYVMTHTTNPLLSSATIGAALAKYYDGVLSGEADSLFSVTRFQTRFYRGDGSAVNHNPANLLRTQDLEPWFEENSNLYVFSEESFARTNARIGAKPMLFETPFLESIDIDEQDQWILASALASYYGKTS